MEPDEEPLSVTVAPASPETVPDSVKVATVAPVKFTPETLALLTVTFWVAGVNEKPVLDGVTVYDPFKTPGKE